MLSRNTDRFCYSLRIFVYVIYAKIKENYYYFQIVLNTMYNHKNYAFKNNYITFIIEYS